MLPAELQPTFGGIIALIALGFSAIQGGFTWVVRQRDLARINAARDNAVIEAKDAMTAAHKVADDLSAHRIEIARKYVAIDMLERVENRLFAAIDGVTRAINELSARLDRSLDRHTV